MATNAIDLIEPLARNPEFDAWVEKMEDCPAGPAVRLVRDAEAVTSAAISLRRIADALERAVERG